MGQQTLLVYSSQLSYSNRTVSFAMELGSQNTNQVISIYATPSSIPPLPVILLYR